MRLDGSALSVWVAIVIDTITVGVPREEGHASSFALYQNYPNPFNPSTMIRFNVPSREHVNIRVVDILGREITTLVDRAVEPGEHTVVFSAWDFHLASGTYFYRMTAGSFVQTKRFMFLQ